MTTDVTNVQNAYMMTLRMFTRAPASLICAMAMSFAINARLACIYLVDCDCIWVGILAFIMTVMLPRYFRSGIFPKYDELNESVQENVSAIRVVKAYVREEQETTSKFQKSIVKTFIGLFVKGGM